ncbi:uncharacterized protein LOC114367730 [Glycine soja]|uniref:uncharacterized protein LOC114367730 n=1 Tax=Glycine soja TaxID=3848 RepID=UPI001039EB61|nr:uncharacterized protein LOC114367730 [Glycine soja]
MEETSNCVGFLHYAQISLITHDPPITSYILLRSVLFLSDACATSTVVPSIFEQVCDFIHSALYHPLHGYFSQRSRSVGFLPNAIKFNQLQDFWLLEKIDPYCSGWLKLHGDHSSKKRKEKENNYETSSFMEEFGLPTKTRTKDGYNPLLDDFKNTKFYLSVPTHNIK